MQVERQEGDQCVVVEVEHEEPVEEHLEGAEASAHEAIAWEVAEEADLLQVGEVEGVVILTLRVEDLEGAAHDHNGRR